MNKTVELDLTIKIDGKEHDRVAALFTIEEDKSTDNWYELAIDRALYQINRYIFKEKYDREFEELKKEVEEIMKD